MKLKSSSSFSQPAKREQLSPESRKFLSRIPPQKSHLKYLPRRQWYSNETSCARAIREHPKYIEDSEHKQEDFGVFSPEVSGFPDPPELREGVKILKPNQIYSTRIGGSQFLVGNQ
ncbi:hypothetical protein L3Y34_003217 [Caenorhabditis briggsae]|uniref:Uncharacterized protein n=1 Tax=Caenorhabditis briggsae TaxID=6238 RepID=A0AAE9ACR8_CAEBR|nr:hypothetical protein L3Y34_003217 [Caenorhabditis briggsae]